MSLGHNIAGEERACDDGGAKYGPDIDDSCFGVHVNFLMHRLTVGRFIDNECSRGDSDTSNLRSQVPDRSVGGLAPALRNLQISGVFATDDTDAFVAFLRSLKGVRVDVTETRIRLARLGVATPHASL